MSNSDDKSLPTTRWWHPHGKAPRDHAAAILKLGKNQKKIEEYIEKEIPEHYREWVAEILMDWAARERNMSKLRRG